MARLMVVDAGPLTTVQDLGRPGHAAVGVPESGALAPDDLRLANRLVGNPEWAAALEVTFGGLALRASGLLTVAAVGAPAPLTVDGTTAPLRAPFTVPDGAELRLGVPGHGVRTVVALRGGVQAPRLLGSASTDLLSGLGRPLRAGDTVEVGDAQSTPVPWIDEALGPTPSDEVLHLRVVMGPRDDWFTPDARRALEGAAWTVHPDSNRIGLRIRGPQLQRAVSDELPSEGTVAGALQVPADGQPVVFLADHPVTGGYPVIAVVTSGDLPSLAQARPGQQLRFHTVAGPVRAHDVAIRVVADQAAPGPEETADAW